MRELSTQDLELVSGAVNWGQVGVGVGSVALGVAIAATPVGWVGAAGATLFSFFGGIAIGDGLIDGSDYNADGTNYNK